MANILNKLRNNNKLLAFRAKVNRFILFILGASIKAVIMLAAYEIYRTMVLV